MSVFNFAPSEEHVLLGDTLKRLVESENEFERRRHRLSRTAPDRLALWPALAEIGALGAFFTEACGGFGGHPLDAATVMEASAAGLVVEPLVSTLIAARVLQEASDTDELIEAVIAGARVVAPAFQEGFDPFAPPRGLTATPTADGWRLEGVKPAVRNGDVADDLLVSAVQPDGRTAVFRVETSQAGIRRTPTRLIDAAGAADISFDNVLVEANARLILVREANAVIADALEWGLAMLAVESAVLSEAANRAAFDYLNIRQQFGQTLARFQALQHRAADMAIAAQEAAAMAGVAVAALEAEPSPERSRRLLSASLACDGAGRRVGHDAVQLFGGVGVSDELVVSHYARRLAAIRHQIGGSDVRMARLVEMEKASSDDDARDTGGDLPTFRREVREFVRDRLPADIAAKVAKGRELHKDDYVRWQKTLQERGWLTGGWSEAWGGLGWGAAQRLAFLQESGESGAPMIIPYGVNMLGPVLQTFGDAAQKAAHIPGIVSSDVWWCQGYSEPGAGSDLAAIKTSAIRDGDVYRVNGSKLWTTEAHWADMMHCLVRTDASGKRQEGISFLLIDMKTPGVTVRPIVTIDGQHHTNEVFFDDVVVPVENLVGEEGDGWKIAKFLLDHERLSIAETGSKLRLLRRLRQMNAAVQSAVSIPILVRARLDARLSELSVRLETLRALESHFVARWAAGLPAGADASMLKIVGTEALQALSELALDLEGPYAAVHDPADLHRPADDDDGAAHQASAMAHHYLYGRCWSIFGGTNEVQRNLIARWVLG